MPNTETLGTENDVPSWELADEALDMDCGFSGRVTQCAWPCGDLDSDLASVGRFTAGHSASTFFNIDRD
ncbi:MAG: hypothetical protein EXQ97_08670 [Alphaproteobacteria bacterium]|nr:hypothetical protein [Alphaproteobacteria bacterium]